MKKVKAFTFDEIVKEMQSSPPPQPLTAEDVELLRELPGLFCLQIPRTPKE